MRIVRRVVVGSYFLALFVCAQSDNVLHAFVHIASGDTGFSMLWRTPSGVDVGILEVSKLSWPSTFAPSDGFGSLSACPWVTCGVCRRDSRRLLVRVAPVASPAGRVLVVHDVQVAADRTREHEVARGCVWQVPSSSSIVVLFTSALGACLAFGHMGVQGREGNGSPRGRPPRW